MSCEALKVSPENTNRIRLFEFDFLSFFMKSKVNSVKSKSESHYENLHKVSEAPSRSTLESP